MANVVHDRRFGPEREAARIETYESMLLLCVPLFLFSKRHELSLRHLSVMITIACHLKHQA